VWSDDQKWCRDLELTSVWADEDDFPKMPDKDNPNVIHIEVSPPKMPIENLREKLRKAIERNFDRHAQRKKYPCYWLANYVNFSREDYGVPPNWVSTVAALALKNKPPGTNVERIRVWTHGSLDLVFP
jgi:hypothetical protein